MRVHCRKDGVVHHRAEGGAPAWIAAFVLALFTFAAPGAAEAAIQLQKVQVSDGSRVDLLFDGAVDPSQLTTEFFNDIIQFSFNETNVYPAKILSVSGKDLTKVFAYQYAPGLVRCRLTVKGRAEDYKDRVAVNASGKILSVRFGGVRTAARSRATGDGDVIETSAARPISAGRGGEGADEGSGMTADEKQLLQRVLQGSRTSSAGTKGESGRGAASASGRIRSTTADSRRAIGSGAGGERSSGRLGGAPDLPSPLKPFGYMLAISAMIIGAGLMFKKLLGRGGNAGSRVLSHRGLTSFLGRIGMPVAPRERRNMIEVLASHPLGQKKSLAIVRVGGVRMVLGISDESINLISRLGNDDDAEDAAQDAASDDLLGGMAPGAADGQAVFEDAIAASLLGNSPAATVEKSTPGRAATAAGRPVFANVLGQEARRQGARDQIRNRLGNMKPL